MPDKNSNQKSNAFTDLLIISIIAVFIYILAILFNIFDKLALWSQRYGTIQVDEIFTVLIIMGFIMAIFSYRRWREVRREIIVRKKAEEQIRILNEKLERQLNELSILNEELDAFNHTVSHDLRTPLMLISGFSHSLVKHHSDKLDKEAIKYLEIIKKTTKNMEQLIDDLLYFSKAGHQDIQWEDIDMKTLVRDIFMEFKPFFNGRAIELKFSDIPPVRGDRILIRQVYANLLSNAIKYTAENQKTEIDIGGWEKNTVNIYYVKDNGIGFDMKESNRLFDIFERLHSPDQFEGTGVGLSIVKRIIERHGGEIWAEGKPNQGATFYFSLPQR